MPIFADVVSGNAEEYLASRRNQRHLESVETAVDVVAGGTLGDYRTGYDFRHGLKLSKLPPRVLVSVHPSGGWQESWDR